MDVLGLKVNLVSRTDNFCRLRTIRSLLVSLSQFEIRIVEGALANQVLQFYYYYYFLLVFVFTWVPGRGRQSALGGVQCLLNFYCFLCCRYKGIFELNKKVKVKQKYLIINDTRTSQTTILSREDVRGENWKYRFTQRDLSSVSKGVISCHINRWSAVSSLSETSGICFFQFCVQPIYRETFCREA